VALRIRIEHGQDAGKTYRLGVPGTYRFGRSPQASVQVLDMKVSKEHFEVGVPEGANGAFLRDCGSSHGTLLNGQPLAPEAPRPLVPGDEIRVGLTVLRVLSDGQSDGEAKPTGAAPTALAAAPPTNGGAPAGPPSSTSLASSSPATGLRASSPAAGLRASSPATGLRASTAGTPSPAKAPAPPDPLVGTTLAGYKILERVGAGGMGAVYRAEQLSLHREVALKVLAEKLVSDGAFVDQFVNEARAAGQLNHPNVVQVYDVGQADGRHYFSMEFIHGGSIESKIPRGAGVPWKDALGWFLDAANALIFAEKKGILHRDIKPDNFMVSQDGSAKLCDLGLAKKSESADLLAQGIIGTPHFIAPEAVRRKTEVDKRADLYSLGCTFYRALTGKNPFPLGSVKEILLAHLNTPPPRVSASVPDVPKELDEIVHRLMQKEPSARFQDAQELWTALDKVRLQSGMEAHGLNPGRAKKVALLVGVVALGAIGVAVYFVTRPPKETTKETVKEIRTGIGDEESNRLKAKADFAEIESDDKVGALEQGANWKKEVLWEGIVKRYRNFAEIPEYKLTEYAPRATARADAIVEYRERQRKRDANEQAQIEAKRDELKDRVAKTKSKVVALVERATSQPDQSPLLEAAEEISKVSADLQIGSDLLPADEVKGYRKQVDDLLPPLRAMVDKAWEAVETKIEAVNGGALVPTAENLTAAHEACTAWMATHPRTDARLGEFARHWNELYGKADDGKRKIETRRLEAVKDEVTKDRRVCFEWKRSAFAPRSDGTAPSGWYEDFDFAKAHEKADLAAKSMKTPAYRELMAALAEDARRAGTLPGRLVAGWAEKPWKDPAKGHDWNGPVEAVLPDGVRVKGALHPWRSEGIAFFLDLFYDPKGQERFALSADDHEALAIFAEAGGVAESSALFDRAAQEWDKARTLDPARAERVAKRFVAVAAEKEARGLLEGAASRVDDANDRMQKLEERLATETEVVAARKVRADILAQQGEIAVLITASRQMLSDLREKFPSSNTMAVLTEGPRPPPGSAYAGEPVAEEEPPPPPAPVAPPAPGMQDDPPAMKEPPPPPVPSGK
jgi:hypothetical protein